MCPKQHLLNLKKFELWLIEKDLKNVSTNVENEKENISNPIMPPVAELDYKPLNT